jgi:hypothetical protein
MTSFVQTVLSLVTAAAMSALSGKVNAAQVDPEPINTPSLTFPGDTVSSSKRGPGCQGIVQLLSTPPVLVAEEKPPEADQTPPNPPQPTRTIIDVIYDQGQIMKKGLKDSLEKLRNRPPIPGS